jgi:hypothetical protein
MPCLPVEQSSLLAKRPYGLRHAGISFWLHSGVDPAELRAPAGQSIEALFPHYAKFPARVQEHTNRLIEQSMQGWDRRADQAYSGPRCDRSAEKAPDGQEPWSGADFDLPLRWAPRRA